MMRVKQHLKRTSNRRIMSRAPTLKFSTILFSSPEFLIKLADVKIIVDPFHPIKNPVHAKNLFSPAPDSGYQLVVIKKRDEIVNGKSL
jgi:hypothetical protein